MSRFENVPTSEFQAEEIINGVTLMCHYDGGYREYVLYFPQISIDHEAGKAAELGINDQVIRISDDQEKAKKVFDFAKAAAQSDNNVLSIYKKVEEFLPSL